MKKMTLIKSLILNNLSLSQIEGAKAEGFESVAEWLEFASDRDMCTLAETAGLIAPELSKADVERIQEAQRQKLAEAAGILPRRRR